MENRLYTIGHSQHDINYFIEMLKKYNINFLLDVRSTPYSQFAETYNKENIRIPLANVGIEYVYMGNFFGARPQNKDLYSKEGYLDFAKVRQYEKFKVGVDNVLKGLEQGNNITLMCTEKDPLDCHRAILVAKAFYDMGIEVQHIMADGKLQSHDKLEERLLDTYFPDRYQFSLFSNDNKSDEECLQEAYVLHNKKIGYNIENL